MRAGSLDRKVDIQRKTVTQDDFGQDVETWTNLSARRSASYMPIKAEERFTADQFIAREQVEFRIRHSEIVANLNALDRVIYPAIDPDASPEDTITNSRTYDIMGVLEGRGRKRELRILCARRPEQP